MGICSSQRIDDSGVIKGHSLKIFDAEGNDFTETFINNPGYQFLVASYSLESASRKGFEKINKLYENVIQDGHSLVVLTGSLEDEIQCVSARDSIPTLNFIMLMMLN